MAAQKTENIPIEELIKRGGGGEAPAADDGYDEVVIDEAKGKVRWKSKEQKSSDKKSTEKVPNEKKSDEKKSAEGAKAAAKKEHSEPKTQPTQPSSRIATIDTTEIKEPTKTPTEKSSMKSELKSELKTSPSTPDRAPLTPKSPMTKTKRGRNMKRVERPAMSRSQPPTVTATVRQSEREQANNSERKQEKKKKGCCTIG